MKNLLLPILILSSIILNAQDTRTAERIAAKARKQQTAAWILAGGGAAMFITGTVILAEHDWDFDRDREVGLAIGSVALLAAGIGCAAGSIPLFIISAKNKRKAASMSFKNEYAPGLKRGGFAYRQIPSVVLRINL
jgi:hypothetical protein